MHRAGVGCGVMLPDFDTSEATEVVPAARLAEELGFESVWAADRLASPAPGLDAPALLAACAVVTERISLGFSALLLGVRSPAWTAKQLVSIDLLGGGGRLRLGVGAERELPALGDAAGDQLPGHGARVEDERLDDALAVIGDLLTGRPVDRAGRILSVRSPALEPALAAAPPICVGGHDEAALRRASRVGDAWMPMWLTPGQLAERSQLLGEMALEQGRAMPRLAAVVAVRIDDGRDRGYAQARRHLAGQYGIEPERIERSALLDSIDGAVERLGQFVEVGVSELVLLTLGRDTLQQYERLADVRERLGSAAAASGTAP